MISVKGVSSILDRAGATGIQLEPFPHLVVENALPPDDYDRLQATKPDFGLRGRTGTRRSNQRIAFFGSLLTQSPAVDEIWKAFIAVHTAPAFFERVIDLFRDRLAEHHPHLAAWLAAHPSPRIGLLNRDSFGAIDVALDCRLEIMTPVHGAASSHRRGHVDAPNRLYSGLFYMREPDDHARPAGDLNLYRWAVGVPGPLDRFEIPEAELVLAKTVPYAANKLVLFPNSPWALHGAAERGISDQVRSYVFITAEVERNLF